MVLAKHFHYPPVRCQVIVPREGVGDPRAIGDLERVLRFELFSSGLKRRKFFASIFNFITSRRNVPMIRVDSAVITPGAGTVTA